VLDGRRAPVEADHLGRVMIASEIRGDAPSAAAHVEHLLPGEALVAHHMAGECDGVTPGPIARLQPVERVGPGRVAMVHEAKAVVGHQMCQRVVIGSEGVQPRGRGRPEAREEMPQERVITRSPYAPLPADPLAVRGIREEPLEDRAGHLKLALHLNRRVIEATRHRRGEVDEPPLSVEHEQDASLPCQPIRPQERHWYLLLEEFMEVHSLESSFIQFYPSWSIQSPSRAPPGHR